MSLKLVSLLWNLDISGSEREVLSALCFYADDDGTNCYPGMSLLKWNLGKSESQTQRILKRLEDRKIIQIVQRGLGRGNASEYILDLTKINPKKDRPFIKPRIQAVKPPIQEIKPRIQAVKPPIQEEEKVASSTGTEIADSKVFILPTKKDPKNTLAESDLPALPGMEAESPPEPKKPDPSKEDRGWEMFRSSFKRKYGEPYLAQDGDWKTYVKFKKEHAGTKPSDWQKALNNFFASIEATHNFKVFLKYYPQLKHGKIDKYGKVIAYKKSYYDPDTYDPISDTSMDEMVDIHGRHIRTLQAQKYGH